MSFSKCSSRQHFSYTFCLASTCYENSDPPRLKKISANSFFYIFPMVFQCFYVSAVRLHVGEVTKTINTMLRHDALKRAHVHENILGVTFGALRFGTRFRLPTMCSETAMIRMLLGTHVPQTTVGVTFGARRRSSPLGLLDRFRGQSDPQDRRRSPERFRLAPVWAPTSPQDGFRTLLRDARDYLQTSGRVSSVDGSAMHMKWPDGIGLEAGIGRTRRGQELTIFRACP